jgi:hypothetical protein
MTDPRSQLAYDLFRQVFMPRNFHYDGMNLRGMMLDYHFHLLRHFYPRSAGGSLRGQIAALLRKLNGSNGDLLERVCRFAESADLNDRTGAEVFARTLAAERARFDEAMRGRCDYLLTRMRERAGERSRTRLRGWSGTAATGVAMVAMVLSTHGCEMAPEATEMAPKPTTPSEPRPPGAGANQPPPGETHRSLSLEEVSRIHEQLAADAARSGLEEVARRHGMVGKTVLVELALTAQGTVAAYRISGAEDDHPKFRKELGRAIEAWRFAPLEAPGRCIVVLSFREPVATRPWGVHMCEMVPFDSPER